MKKSFLLCIAFFSLTLAFAQAQIDIQGSLASTDTNFENALTEKPLTTRKASFPGGERALNVYLSSHFEFSSKAVENNLVGTVIVRFTVREDGKPVNIEIKQSLHPIVDEAALNVIRSMPDWIPAVKKGHPVAANVEIPFSISLR